MAKQPITSWYPYFDASGNFVELKGWDVVLRQIFTVLVTRPGTRQWQPEFGCTLLDMLFEPVSNESQFNDIIKAAFKWLPHVTLQSVNCSIVDMSNHTGKQVKIALKVGYSGETRDVSFIIPPQLDLLNGQIHNIKVLR